MIANPHVFTLEDGSRYKRVDADQLGFKHEVDPYGSAQSRQDAKLRAAAGCRSRDDVSFRSSSMPSRRRCRRRRPARRSAAAAARRASARPSPTARLALADVDLDDSRRANSSACSARRAAANRRCCKLIAGLGRADSAARSTGRNRPTTRTASPSRRSASCSRSRRCCRGATAADNVYLPLMLAGVGKQEARDASRRRLAHGRAVGASPIAYPRATVRRHEDARLDRPRAGHAAANPADGRAVRRARRDHAQQAQRRSAASCSRPAS